MCSVVEHRMPPDKFSPSAVSDSLQHVPERATIVAIYKHLVVGCAILSSPVETYITYLAVRAGWENVQIATYAALSSILEIVDTRSLSVMLFHLIDRNPYKDITLHVSANNPAMVRDYPSLVIKFPNHYPKATLQSVWFQGRRIHRRLLRRLPRPAVTDVKKCVPFTAPPLGPQTRVRGANS